MCKPGVISQEWLKISVKLLLTANRKSYMPCRFAQQRMTLVEIAVEIARARDGWPWRKDFGNIISLFLPKNTNRAALKTGLKGSFLFGMVIETTE